VFTVTSQRGRMTEIDAIETSLPAATAPRVWGDGATIGLAGEPYERRRVPGIAGCPVLPKIEPGQVWVVEHSSADFHLGPLGRRVISAANVVIYDRTLYTIVAANLPLGGYAEPASSPEKPFETPIDRCLQLARDGWSVVWLVDHWLQRRQRAERIGHLVDRLIDGGYPAHLSVAVFANGPGSTLEKTEASLGQLEAVIDARTSGDHLTVAFGGLGRGAAPDLYAISSNGLAG
jgi:hypothetical protein